MIADGSAGPEVRRWSPSADIAIANFGVALRYPVTGKIRTHKRSLVKCSGEV
jgi:hypothetical protein